MKQSRVWRAVLMGCAAASASLAAAKEPFRIVYNNDGSDPWTQDFPTTVESLRRIVDLYADSGLTELSFTVRGGPMAYCYPTKFGSVQCLDWSDEELRREEYERRIKRTMSAYLDKGIDPLEVLIQRAHQRGMKFSGSFRVDDFVPDGQWYSKFINSRLWYERPEYRIEGNCNWDYSKPQVRDFFLGAMRELVERYEIDGLELDFCNNGPFYPKDLPDQEKFMTEFMRNLRETTHRVGAKRERPIMLSAMIRTRNFGAEIAWDAAGSRLDLETWCRERLIDRLEPTFFAAEDQIEADAQAFLEMARGSNVELYAQVQARRRAEPRLARTQADFSALEEKCRVLGFDGVHYMNYFVYRGVNHPGREFRSLNVRYTADELPTTAANIWIEDRTAAGPVELANGVLHLRGPVAYQRDPAMLSSGNRELTVEVRVKVGSAKGERFCGLSVANGQRQVMIDLGPDCLAVYEGEKLLNTIKTDLTKFRTIRLTLTGGHVANIYLDASSDPVISTPLSQAAKHWQVRWGNLTTEPLAESYWDALHYTLDGAYGPGDRVRVGSVKATVQSFEAAGVSGPSGVEHSAARSQLFSKRRARSRTTRAALVL